MKSKYQISITIVALLITLQSCRKFVEVDPPIDKLTAKVVFSNDISANVSINGIYSAIMGSGSLRNKTPYAAMSADELNPYVQDRIEFRNNQLTLVSSGALNSSFWNPAYNIIYSCNAAIQELELSEGVSSSIKPGLIGEAKFLRASQYLDLINEFGDVPLVLATDYQTTGTLPRTAKSEVMKQIIQDLKDAVEVLSPQVASEKIRANKWAAMSLLSRVYLYNEQWDLAEKLSNDVIESKLYQLNTNLNQVFLKNSSEAILQYYPTQVNQNTPDGVTFLPVTAREQPKYSLTSSLTNAFEYGDLRASSWVGSRVFSGQTYLYPAKYKVIGTGTLSEYYMFLRLAEQYLIRAEAKIQQNKIGDGIADLNVIRSRARTIPTSPTDLPLPALNLNLDKATALLKVEQERRIELMFEMGHRWFDLNRTGRSNAVLEALKPTTWQATDMLWPIPVEQRRLNPNLTQNPGYTF